jgi:hypothetical protein
MFLGVRVPKSHLFPVPSAQKRVLAIPELLDIIISFLEKGDALSCALVSKAWSTVALDVLWREIDSGVDLLRQLGPMCSDAISDSTNELVGGSS